MSHISQKEFEKINWLSIKEQYLQCINTITFKYLNNQCPHYLNEVFMKVPGTSSSLRNSYQNFSNLSHLSLVRHCGNKVPKEIKKIVNLNAFKHNLKKHYFKELGKANF